MIVVPGEIADYVDVPDLAVWYGGDTAPIREARFYVPSYMAGEWAFEVMAEFPHLEVCQLPTAGYEHALEHLPAGVTLCNAAGVHDASTAELVVGLILTRLRRLDDMARAMPRGEFLHDRFDALADKSVVVVGAGGIGQALRRRLEGFSAMSSSSGVRRATAYTPVTTSMRSSPRPMSSCSRCLWTTPRDAWSMRGSWRE